MSWRSEKFVFFAQILRVNSNKHCFETFGQISRRKFFDSWQGRCLFHDGGNPIESKCRMRSFPRIFTVGRKKYLGENYPAQRQQHSVSIWHPAHQLWASPEPLSVSQSSGRHFRWVFDQTPPAFFAQRSLLLACAHAFRHTTFAQKHLDLLTCLQQNSWARLQDFFRRYLWPS